MTVNSMKPVIRFRGFNDAWEQRKLETIYDKIRNAFVGTATPYYVPQGNFYLESNNVKDGQINRNSEIFINDEFYLRQKDNWLRTGDMVMVQSGHVGHAAVIPPQLNNSAAHALIIFSNPKEIINPYFLNYQYQTSNYKKAIDNITTGNTIKHILSSEMKKFTVLLTHIEEQNKISEFFIGLDNLITLHQRKLVKLKNVKKAMLGKMFPKDGSDVPEIRFAGFTDAWEQRKVKDLFKVTRGNVLAATITSEKKTEDAPYSVYSSQTKQNGLMGYYKEFLYEDAITWTTDGANAGTVNYRAGKFYCTNVCGVLLSNEIKANQMIAEALNNIAKKYVSYVGNPKLMNNVMADIEIKLPSQEKERDTISSFFCDLDNLITLHQRKLDKLKNIKKACLDKMFV